MPTDGKVRVGEALDDWQVKPGYKTVVVAVQSGRLPAPFDPRSPWQGSTAEKCALYGGPAHSDTLIPQRRKVTP